MWRVGATNPQASTPVPDFSSSYFLHNGPVAAEGLPAERRHASTKDLCVGQCFGEYQNRHVTAG
jgi:hypothetical protein